MIPITRTTDPRRRSGFTLIELLVVIAIIAVLIAPALARRPGGARGGPAGTVHQQPQADRLWRRHKNYGTAIGTHASRSGPPTSPNDPPGQWRDLRRVAERLRLPAGPTGATAAVQLPSTSAGVSTPRPTTPSSGPGSRRLVPERRLDRSTAALARARLHGPARHDPVHQLCRLHRDVVPRASCSTTDQPRGRRCNPSQPGQWASSHLRHVRLDRRRHRRRGANTIIFGETAHGLLTRPRSGELALVGRRGHRATPCSGPSIR